MDEKLIVKSRDEKGSAGVRRMRRAGLVPGVVYGEGGEGRAVSLSRHEFEQMLHHHAGEQMMVSIELDGRDASVLLKDVQHEPLSGNVLHVDFQVVSLTERLRVHIPVELVGEPKGVKNEGGVLEHSLFSLEVECLPGDIFEKIEVDVSALMVGDSVPVKEIGLDPSRYEILMDEDVVVASVLSPRVAAAEGEEGAEAGSAEPEVIKEKKPADAE